MPRDFEDFTIQELEDLFAAESGDRELLAGLDEEIKYRDSAAAKILRLKIIQAKIALRPKSQIDKHAIQKPLPDAAPVSKLQQRTRPLLLLLSKYQLAIPDGRPLHGYRLDAATYDDLENVLLEQSSAGRLHNYNREDAALFVIWAAEWFRREYRGGLRKYEEFGDRLGVNFEQAHWRALIDDGIEWWRRRVVNRGGSRHRLLTVALEGGFPARVLEEHGNGWLARYLIELVGRLLAAQDPNEDIAYSVAWECREKLRVTYQTEDFCHLSADLALAVVCLRREAASAGPGLQASGVLDAVHPGWRETLPIASEGEAAQRLIDGMMTTPVLSIGDGEIGTIRLLIWDGAIWRAGIRLGLKGEIAGNKLSGLRPSDGRVRVHAHGALARAIAQELALLDPPSEDSGTWLLRPLLTNREVMGVSLASRVEVSLHAGGRMATTILWPRGEAITGDVLTFDIDREECGKPLKLALIARGSGKVRPQRVVVQVPSDWAVVTAQSTAEQLGVSEDGGTLWLTEHPLIATSPDGTLAYRVEPGHDAAVRDQIKVSGNAPIGLFSDRDNIPLFAGAPDVHCMRNNAAHRPRAGELLWRRDRSEPWRDLLSVPLEPGLIDIVWKDISTQFVHDRVRVAVFPNRFYLKATSEADTQIYTFTNLQSLRVTVCDAAGLQVTERGDGKWALSFSSQPKRHVEFEFEFGYGLASRPIRAAARFRLLKPGLAYWDGELIPQGSELTPAILSDLVAFGDGRNIICATLIDPRKSFTSDISYSFSDELPLRGLASQLDAELRASSIDARIDFAFTGSGGRSFFIKRFDSEIIVHQNSITVKRLPRVFKSELTLVARSIEAPDTEEILAKIGMNDVPDCLCYGLPDDFRGSWLVYLRIDGIVRSRPQFVHMPGRFSPNSEGLAEIATIADLEQRRAALVTRMDEISGKADGSDADLDWLSRLVTTLQGLPARTFDALTMLEEAPAVLAMLMLRGDEAIQTAVWALEKELSFLWVALPLSAWKSAASIAVGAIRNELLGTPLAGNSDQLARDAIQHAAANIRRIDIGLDAALGMIGLGGPSVELPDGGLHEVASDYVRRTIDRGDDNTRFQSLSSRFRQGYLASLLPPEFEVFNPLHLDMLDAPCAAALSAWGHATLTRKQVSYCKIAMVTDPIYFEQGFIVMLDLLRQAQVRLGE